jgi:hypothetical protein
VRNGTEKPLAPASSQGLVVCDTNVWIEASRDADSDAGKLLARSVSLRWTLAVSKHSLAELAAGSERYGPLAERLAREQTELPYFPIGSIDELLGTIGELAGTLGDMNENERRRDGLGELASAGTNIRDRGALIDAIRAGADFFVTSDAGLCGNGPRGRIEQTFPICVRCPGEMIDLTKAASLAAK